MSTHTTSPYPAPGQENIQPQQAFVPLRQSPHHKDYDTLSRISAIRLCLADLASPSLRTYEDMHPFLEVVKSYWPQAQIDVQALFLHNTGCKACKLLDPTNEPLWHPMPPQLQERIENLVREMQMWGSYQISEDRDRAMDQFEEFLYAWRKAEHDFLMANLNSKCCGLFGDKNPGSEYQG